MALGDRGFGHAECHAGTGRQQTCAEGGVHGARSLGSTRGFPRHRLARAAGAHAPARSQQRPLPIPTRLCHCRGQRETCAMHCAQVILRVALVLAVSGCASTTTISVSPSPQTPVCDASRTALVLWRTQWRADQKDVIEREKAAAAGIARFFETSGCFQSVAVERLPQFSEDQARQTAAAAANPSGRVVLLSVRELGPIVKLGSSIALVEGGTEAVLDVSEFVSGAAAPRTFAVRWSRGGPGVLKGVASLPQDMQAALAAALQPASR